jgi:hypothetical protein
MAGPTVEMGVTLGVVQKPAWRWGATATAQAWSEVRSLNAVAIAAATSSEAEVAHKPALTSQGLSPA